MCGAGLKLVETDEYSESGRGIYPDGLYRMLLQFNDRYKHLNIPFIITENGVSDETDIIRRPYLLEHLLAVHAAKIMVIPITLLSCFSNLVFPIFGDDDLVCREFVFLVICFGLYLITGSGQMGMDPSLDW